MASCPTAASHHTTGLEVHQQGRGRATAPASPSNSSNPQDTYMAPFYFPSIRELLHRPNEGLHLPTGPLSAPLSASQFSSVTQSCPTLCDPVDCSMPGLPVHHQLLELAQIHVHRVGDAIQPSHPLSSPSPPPSIFPSIRVFSNGSVLHIRWPK